jgi:two-component system, NarL family, response regulator NreC
MKKITLVLAEDWVMVRQGVRALLELEKGFSIVGECGDGLETVKLVERLKPDVLVLGLMLPSLNGLDVVFHIGQKSLPTRAVILTMHANEAYVLEALRNGAYGYVLKDTPFEELVTAIREVHAGRKYLCRPLSEIRIKDYLLKSNERQLNRFETLTARQREVVQLVAEGRSSREIGRLLGISRRTVETHRAQAMKMFGVNKQTDLVRFVLQQGIPPIVRPPVPKPSNCPAAS